MVTATRSPAGAGVCTPAGDQTPPASEGGVTASADGGMSPLWSHVLTLGGTLYVNVQGKSGNPVVGTKFRPPHY